MILQRIKYFFTKNPLDLLNYEELLSDRIKYDHEIDNLHEKITAIEKDIENCWTKAKETKSPADERALAERINTLSQKRDSFSKKISKAESRLRSVEEFINKIEDRRSIRSTAPLIRGSPSDIEKMLEQIKIIEEWDGEKDTKINEFFEPKIDDIDDNVNEILQAIKATKKPETYKIASDKDQVSAQQKNLELDN